MMRRTSFSKGRIHKFEWKKVWCHLISDPRAAFCCEIDERKGNGGCDDETKTRMRRKPRKGRAISKEDRRNHTKTDTNII